MDHIFDVYLKLGGNLSLIRRSKHGALLKEQSQGLIGKSKTMLTSYLRYWTSQFNQSSCPILNLPFVFPLNIAAISGLVFCYIARDSKEIFVMLSLQP